MIMDNSEQTQYLQSLVRDIPDFPKPGILFKDITPLLNDTKGFSTVIDILANRFLEEKVDTIIGIESRGFIFGAPLALRLGASFVPARKPGKLPAKVDRVSYKLEYGSAELEMHSESIKPGSKVVVVDDLLATGGTAVAAKTLVSLQGGTLHAFAFVIELLALDGRKHLSADTIVSLLKY